MNLYGLFILGVNIKYLVFSILYRHINVPMACKELSSPYKVYRVRARCLEFSQQWGSHESQSK